MAPLRHLVVQTIPHDEGGYIGDTLNLLDAPREDVPGALSWEYWIYSAPRWCIQYAGLFRQRES